MWFRRKLILVITLFVTVIGYIQVNEIKNIYSATSNRDGATAETRVVDIESVLNRQNSYGGGETRSRSVALARVRPK